MRRATSISLIGLLGALAATDPSVAADVCAPGPGGTYSQACVDQLRAEATTTYFKGVRRGCEAAAVSLEKLNAPYVVTYKDGGSEVTTGTAVAMGAGTPVSCDARFVYRYSGGGVIGVGNAASMPPQPLGDMAMRYVPGPWITGATPENQPNSKNQ